jgi:hypothetical protein
VGRMTETSARLAVHGCAAALIAIAAVSPGCGSSDDSDGDGGGDSASDECYVAFAADFQSYKSWQHYHLTAPFSLEPAAGSPGRPDGGVNLVHMSGPRDVYINRCPPAGATEFPVGTIIVKEIALASLPPGSPPAVFAQVKRGCGFNSAGASGWEWFDLLTPDNGGGAGPVTIIWNGLTPPQSQSYGGDPTECNTCHAAMGADNDSIITSALNLKDLASGVSQCKEP